MQPPQILYLNNRYFTSTPQLKRYIQSALDENQQNELIAALRDGMLVDWLQAGDDVSRHMAEKAAQLQAGHQSLGNNEVLEQLGKIFELARMQQNKYKFDDYAAFDCCLVDVMTDGRVCTKQAASLQWLHVAPSDRVTKVTFRFTVKKTVKDHLKLDFVTQPAVDGGHARLQLDVPAGQAADIVVPQPLLEALGGQKCEISLCHAGDCVAKLSLKPSKRSETAVQDDEFDDLSFTVKWAKFRMVRVEGGTFTMGATPKQAAQAYDDERLAHQVTLRSYYIGQMPVTQELWRAVMGETPSYHSRRNDYRDCGRRPVEQVSWDDCKRFIDRLNELLKDQLNGKRFRLPTEAEWEFAARGGNKGKDNDHLYAGSDDIDEVAWFDYMRCNQTHPVMQKQPNELVLYDMSGNVWEWCEDWYGSYGSDAQTDPTGPAWGSYRVHRGGSWFNYARYCRVSSRGYSTPSSTDNYLGLRLAL